MPTQVNYNGQIPTFAIADTILSAPVKTISTQDNVNLLQQQKSSFKITVNRNKYQSTTTIKNKDPYLDLKTDENFNGVNKLFVLSFEDNDDRNS